MLVTGFSPRRPVFETGSSHVGVVVDKVALGQVFSEYFGFPYQFSFHRLLHIHHHISSEAGTVGQLVAAYQVGSASSQHKKLFMITLPCRKDLLLWPCVMHQAFFVESGKFVMR
jgi:hypothetical protein